VPAMLPIAGAVVGGLALEYGLSGGKATTGDYVAAGVTSAAVDRDWETLLALYHHPCWINPH